MAAGRYEEAWDVICRTNTFPAVCAHICQRPCEKECRRAQLDAPVGLRALKRFVVERLPRHGAPPAPPGIPLTARVAVVGAGPAGLTAAHDLRRRGCGVAVYERLDRPGGMLNVIPRYRLPAKALGADIEAILASGIEMHGGCEVGSDITVGELLDRGFDAVIVASGLSRSRGIAVPGFGAQRFTAAIPWMTDVWLGEQVDVGRRVAVIGGGNVAVDVARTARRLGAEHVAMICLESLEEMPAEPEEVRLARAEGIQILPRQALKRVLNRDGAIAALELMSVVSVFDEEGRFRPSYDPSRIRTLSADMVVLSVGQGPDRSWARGSSVRTDARGRIIADGETHVTSHPRIFVAGESLRGPGSAIAAVADGHRAAAVVGRFLETGQVARPDEDEGVALAPFPQDVLEKLHQMTPIDTEPAPFAASEPSIDEAAARREAARCLGCMSGAVIDENKCASCLTCVRVCPLGAVEIGETMVASPVRCQACGVCASVCPGHAIELSFWELGGPEVQPLVPPGPSAEAGGLAVVCRHRQEGDPPAGQVLEVPCLARLKPMDVLRLVGRGYRDISLYPCAEEQCKYGPAWGNIQSVVDYLGSVLASACPEARVALFVPQTAAPGESPQET